MFTTARRTLLNLIVLLAVALTGVAVSGAAAPANAATTQSAKVCFVHGNGSPYTYDVYAQRWNGSSFVTMGQARSVNGCLTWNLGTSGYWQFVARYQNRGATSYWYANSGWAWVGAGSFVNFGTYYVRLY